jgi:hypothetical protein
MGKLRSIGSLLALTNCNIKFTLKTALLHGFFGLTSLILFLRIFKSIAYQGIEKYLSKCPACWTLRFFIGPMIIQPKAIFCLDKEVIFLKSSLKGIHHGTNN